MAIKVLKPRLTDPEGRQRRRFVAEGRTLAKLVHPNIVLVHDAGETVDGLGYLVMELCEAGTLEAELERRVRLSLEETLGLLLPLMGALAYAHGRGIIHRDLKPANIVLGRERDDVHAKLLDFGIATRADNGQSSDRALGTPSYMAPEQARGHGHAASVDVWSVGVIFYRCLVGEVPFSAPSSMELLYKVTTERAPRFGEALPSLPSTVAIALDRSLQRDPKSRYPDMPTFAHALATACAYDGVPVPSDPDPIGLPAFKRWLVTDDVLSTRPLDTNARVQLNSAFQRSTRRRWPRRLALAALTAAGLAAMPLYRSAPESVSREPRRANLSTTPAVAQRGVEVSPPPAGITIPVLAPPRESGEASATAAPLTRQLPAPLRPKESSTPRHSSIDTTKRKRGGDPVESTHHPAEPHARRDLGMIKNWEW